MRLWFLRVRQHHPILWRLFITYELFLLVTVALGAVSRWLVIHFPINEILAFVVVLCLLGPVILYILTGPLDSVIYYKVILGLVHRANKKRAGFCSWIMNKIMTDSERYQADLILASQLFFDSKEGIYPHSVWDFKERPSVIRREDAKDSTRQADAEFSIVLVFNELKLQTIERRTELFVSLEGETCAVYNGRGKEFLRHHFLSTGESDKKENLKKLSRDIHYALMHPKENGELSFRIPGLRWVSGGFLPIVRWRGRQWVALFFRDIYPVGWNIANGASENSDEYTDLNYLIYREAQEELAICGSLSETQQPIRNSLLCPSSLPNRLHDELKKNPRLADHRRLRRKHDHLHLMYEVDTLVQTSNTPLSLRVQFQDEEMKNRSVPTPNVLIAVNPCELGIEVIKLGEFNLGESDVILDGEINTSGPFPYLVRQPVGLISVNYLRNRFAKRGGCLGDTVNDPSSPDAKDVGGVPSGEYHVFLDDVRLRKERLKELRSSWSMTNIEKERIEIWLDKLEKQIEGYGSTEYGRSLGSPFTWFLPTTWKTLELAFQHQVLR